MNKYLLAFGLYFFLLFSANAQKTPKRELRGAWITTYLSLDWPNRTQTTTQQKAALISILDQHKATRMNAMYFQIRSQCDAMYPSKIEPWSSALNGVQGSDPGWDPLQFAIDECHKRGMELHAWINPYRAVANASNLSSFSSTHVAKQHPEWLLNNGSTITLNPGLSAVRDYIMSVITDVVQRYDVDGIHFDDYFYPPATFNDDAAYTADPRGFPATTTGRADWRRDNINLLIKRVDETVTGLKSWMKFGVSPSGIYRSKTSTQDGSNTSTGANQHYKDAYADTRKWLEQGWVDYIAPQLYWYIGQAGSDYKILVPWWNDNAFGRHIYIGLAIYKVNDPAQGVNWANRSQIPNQMRMNREAVYSNVLGEISFRTAFLRSNPLNVRDSIRLNIYKKPALPPVMSWKDGTTPQPPSNLVGIKQPDNSYILNWAKLNAINELEKARQFVIYRSESPVFNIEDTAYLLAISNTDVSTYTDVTALADRTYYYTVTSVNRLYVESAPSNITDYVAPTITCPGDQQLTLNGSCSVAMPDYRSGATVSDDVSTAENITIAQSPAIGNILNGTGNTIVTLTATDASGKSSSCTFTVKKEDKEAPSLTVPPNITLGTDKDQCSAIVNYNVTASDNCSPVKIVSDHPSGSVFEKGTTKVTITATDESGNKTVKTFTVNVKDEQPPAISSISATPNILWPPNHKMRDVTVNYIVTDNCPGNPACVLSVSSNEPVNGASDWIVTANDAHHLQLRAERNGRGNGRVYTITSTCTDASGNTSSKTTTVVVPHDRNDVKKTHDEDVITLDIKVSPNPSHSSFTLQIEGDAKEKMSLIITDLHGRVMESRNNINPGIIRLGENLKPGVYYIELQQGIKKKQVMIIKVSY